MFDLKGKNVNDFKVVNDTAESGIKLTKISIPVNKQQKEILLTIVSECRKLFKTKATMFRPLPL